MKLIKLRSIEILTNGCLNFSYANPSKLKQIKINEKDYNTLVMSQKQKTNSNKSFSGTIYKDKFLNN